MKLFRWLSFALTLALPVQAPAQTIIIGHGMGAPQAAVTPAFSNFVLDAATDQIEWIFQAPEAITVSNLGFRYGVRTGTPPTYVISLQGVNTSGRCDGTIKGATNNAQKTFTPPASTAWDGTWQWQVLNETATVARGDLLCILVDHSSGTINGTNNGSFTTGIASMDSYALPFSIEVNAGTAAFPSARIPVYGYKSSSKSYGKPIEAMNTPAYASNTGTADEYALKFTVPAGWCDTYNVFGGRIWLHTLSTDATNGLIVRLFDGTSVIQDVSLQADVLGNASTGQREFEFHFNEADLTELTCGNTYRLSLFNESTTTNVALRTIVGDAAQELDPFPLGQNAVLDRRLDAGAWENTIVNERPLFSLWIEAITEPAGGSGGGFRLAGAGGLVAR